MCGTQHQSFIIEVHQGVRIVLMLNCADDSNLAIYDHGDPTEYICTFIVSERI
jgi:hypothetical protein